MSVRAPSNGFSGKDLPPVERPGAPSFSDPRPSIGWMIGGSVALAAGLELFGRYLYKAHGVGYGVTGTLTLLATVVWGASAVHVIRRAHGAPHATRAGSSLYGGRRSRASRRAMTRFSRSRIEKWKHISY